MIYSVAFLSLKLFITTLTLLIAIANPANIGLSKRG